MDRRELELAIAAQERLRGAVPDAIVDAAVAVLRGRLVALESGASRRRGLMTVLFADLIGFTEMSESMDAEDVTAVMNAVWTRLDEVVVRHGGLIDKHIGDALMAIWGARSTQEDDPEQAVRAALGLHEALHDVAESSGLALTLRVGVNTGPVLVGAIGSGGELTAMGDAVNVASRLEHTAVPGTVLMAHATYRHVRGVFDVRPLEPLVIKGKAEPVRVYTVVGVKPRAFRVPSRGVQGVETRMVGREAELAVLREAFEAVVSGRQATLATVVGDAGAGKSRLLYEFENWLELLPRPVSFLAGRALSQRRGVPLALIRDVVAARFEIIDSDPSDVVFAKLVTAAAGVLEPLEVAVLGRWLGFDLGNAQTSDALSGEGLKLAGRAHLSTLLPGLAADAPVVLLLEDVHWADDDSVDVLGHLLATSASTPMLVVATSRPDPSEAPRRLEFVCPRATRVLLGALTSSETRALVVEILQQADEVPADVIDVIVRRAEGNPFYVEELVKMLIDDGIVDTDGPDGRWVIDNRHLDDSRVPATLTGVLQARLDALPDQARRSMQHASIIGRIFWDDAVSALGDGAAGLGPAATRELILPRHPSTFDACNEFIFKHALLHDVAYETVLLSDRPVLHGRAAAWLERTVGDRRDEFLIEIAEHRRRAGDLPGAAELLCVASEVALRSGSPQAARDLAERAVELSRAAEVVSPRALTSLARTCRQLGQLTAAERAAREAIEAARDAAEDVLVDALYEGARLASALGEVVRAQELLDEALPIAERLGGAALCQVLVLMAWFANSTGDPAATLRIAERALRLATNTSNPELMTNAHMVHAAAVCELGDFEQAIAHGRAALEIVRSSGDIVGEAEQLLNVGVVWHLRGDADGAADHYRHAEAYYRMCLDLSGRLSLRERQSTALCNLAQVRIRLGDPVAALAAASEALSLAIEISALHDCLAAILFHADALIAIGDISTGLSHIGAVRRHPAVGHLSQEVDRILARLDSVRDEQLEEHLARGAHLTIDDIVMQIHGPHRPTNTSR